MPEPAKIKKYLLIVIQVLIVVELLEALGDGLNNNDWWRLGFDLVVAGTLYLLWGRIKRSVEAKRREVREKVEMAPENLRLRDALAFSILWSDEIYKGIPKDRNRLIIISYTLIGIGLLVGSFVAGSGLMHLVVSAVLVLAAVNLLVWVVSTERGEKESLQTELHLARQVQSSLMPKSDPVIAGFDVSGRSVPANEVGGDHFAYRITPAAFDVSVFDVSGKGIHAAMSAVFVNGALASELQSDRSPAESLTNLNRLFYEHSRRGNFVSFLLARVNRNTRSLVFANAGQVKPLLIGRNGLRWLDGEGVNFPLGMVETTQYSNREMMLEPGDILMLLTDGVTEAMNPARELFSSEGLEAAIADLDRSRTSAAQLIDEVSACIRRHMNGYPQHDDMTIVAIKIL